MSFGKRNAKLLRRLFVSLIFLLPMTARAHAPIAGLGDFVNGIAHPLITPAHLLILIGVGLLIGQHPPLSLKIPVLIFAPISGIALLLTAVTTIKAVYLPVLIAIALVAGILVALEKKPPAPVVWMLLAAGASAIGFDSGVESDSKTTIAKSLLGTWISLLVILCDAAIYAAFATKKEWLRVGLRVLGAWIIAVGVLVLAFSFRK